MHGQSVSKPPHVEIFDQLKTIVAKHYDIGQVMSAERNPRGYINASYDIEAERDGTRTQYLLRQYRSGTHENRICFEHALMKELLSRGFGFSPRLIATKHGTTYAKVAENRKEGEKESFVAVFSYLPGEDKFTWDDPLCTVEELETAAEVFAHYHNAIYGWEGVSSWEEPRIIDQISLMRKQWRVQGQEVGDSPFNSYFLEYSDSLFGVLDSAMFFPTKEVYDGLPHLAIHGDFHPGNLKYSQGKISGLFDFDWAKMDTRCFDVGLAIFYFCTSWGVNSDGDLLVDRVELFLDSYQKAAKETATLGPLTTLELQILPQMIVAGNAYILDWIRGEFCETRPDADEFLRYLRHGVKLMKWLERNWTSLKNLILRRRYSG